MDIKCKQCGIPVVYEQWSDVERGAVANIMQSSDEVTCRVCASMYAAIVAQAGLRRSHEEWHNENVRRAKRKMQLLAGQD